MAFLTRLFASLACIYCWSELAAGYAIGNPGLSGLQHVFPPPGKIVLDILDFPSKQTLVPAGLEEWIQHQRASSYQYLFDNIAPNGTNAREAAPGAVIASPSKKAPNYYYFWVRDAAITMGGVVEALERTGNGKFKDILEAYAELQGNLQNTFNPSGGYTTGGLGEPKFQVDGAPFAERWARPQRDGPALRALTLMRYLRALNETDPAALDKNLLSQMYDAQFPTHSIIKADLEYVSHHWNLTGFDLWEEIRDLHFYTAIVQRKALVEGRDLAIALHDPSAAAWYESHQLKLKDFLETSFWNKERGHLVASLDNPDRSGMDCALLLGALHGGREDLFPPWSDKILASLEALVSDMKERYPINKRYPPYHPEEDRLRGVGIGRYPEDRYDGVGLSIGHPWFLCTSSASNILYNAIQHFLKQGYLDVNDANFKFFNKLHRDGRAVMGRYPADSAQFKAYLVDMFKYADSFLNVIRWHATKDGHLSEQFNRYTGMQRGAKQLTWSHGSFVGAAIDRDSAKEALKKSRVVIQRV